MRFGWSGEVMTVMLRASTSFRLRSQGPQFRSLASACHRHSRTGLGSNVHRTSAGAAPHRSAFNGDDVEVRVSIPATGIRIDAVGLASKDLQELRKMLRR